MRAPRKGVKEFLYQNGLGANQQTVNMLTLKQILDKNKIHISDDEYQVILVNFDPSGTG